MRFAFREYIGRNVDIDKLMVVIEDFLKEEGFIVHTHKDGNFRAIQAKKGGVFRPILSDDRYLTLLISGIPNDLTIRLGVSAKFKGEDEFLKSQHSYRNIFVEIPEVLWIYEFEHHLWLQVEDSLSVSYL